MKLLKNPVENSSIESSDKTLINKQVKQSIQYLFHNYIKLINQYKLIPKHKYSVLSAITNNDDLDDDSVTTQEDKQKEQCNRKRKRAEIFAAIVQNK